MVLQEIEKEWIVVEKGQDGYPTEWLSLTDAPEKLYALGNLALLKERKLTVVGSRRTPANILKLAEKTAKELSKKFVILTGTADGGDTSAIQGGLSNPQGKGVICLLAGGMLALPQSQIPLLKKVMEKGLLLSVQEPNVPAREYSYEYRNKLLAHLGLGTFVLGAGEKSGALITAKYTEKQRKPIFAFPYPPSSAYGVGCNRLIKQGGKLVECAEDIAEYFSVDLTVETPTVSLTQDEEKLYSALKQAQEMHAVELSERTGIPVYKIRAITASLEVKGLVVALGGNCYTAV